MEQPEKPFQLPENLDAVSVADLRELEKTLVARLQSLVQAMESDASLEPQVKETDAQLAEVQDMINRKKQPGE